MNINNDLFRQKSRTTKTIQATIDLADKNEHAGTEFWYVCVSYGSCSVCDTLEAIQSDGDYTDTPNEKQTDDYMTLALHIAQAIKKLDTSVVAYC